MSIEKGRAKTPLGERGWLRERAKSLAASLGIFSMVAASVVAGPAAMAAETDDQTGSEPTYETIEEHDARIDAQMKELSDLLAQQVKEEQAERDVAASTSPTLRGIAPFAAGDGYIAGPKPAIGYATAAGWGYEWNFNISGMATHWLGAMVVDGVLQWCRNFDSAAPIGSGSQVAVTPRPLHSDPDVARAQVTSNDQMGYIINKWAPDVASVNDESRAAYAAAVSIIVHMSYEDGNGVNYLDNLAGALLDDGSGRTLLQLATVMVDEAQANTGPATSFANMKLNGNKQTFTMDNIGVQRNGAWIPGITVKIQIKPSDPAFFTSFPNGSVSADGKTWTGVTVAGPLSVSGASNGNGAVNVKTSFSSTTIRSVIGVERYNDTQYTIKEGDPRTQTPDPFNFDLMMVHTFQPVLESSTTKAGAHIVQNGETVLRDHLTVSADQTYPQKTWLGEGPTYVDQDTYVPLKVKFKGTAYDVGNVPVAEQGTVPAGSKVVATAEFIANGPGEYDIEAPFDGNPRFITWVWEMDKSDQPSIKDSEKYMLAADWSDAFGIADEHTSITWGGEIESNLKVHTTNNNTYLVDDVWVTGFAPNHPDFEGAFGYGADTKTISQKLYFWAEGQEVKDTSNAELIGEVDIAAKNGFYPSVGDLVFKLKKDDKGEFVKGTYQMVHEFAGDDRSKAFVSQIPDMDEQYVVSDGPIPTIGTTAVGDVEGLGMADSELTITDTVQYRDLKPNTEYTVKGKLMDKATGEVLKTKGGNLEGVTDSSDELMNVVGETTFTTPKSSEETVSGTVDVVFTIDATGLEGKTTVVFEDLFLDDVEVATHSDIEDEGQTIRIPDLKTTANGSVEDLVSATEKATVTDTVAYTNLIPGKEYTVKGVLMNKATGEPLKDGNDEVRASKTFTPEEANGTVDLVFIFNASALQGETLVVFEDLFRQEIQIATHSDIEDEDQTVHFPKIGTEAVWEGGKKSIDATTGKVTIVDTVCYEGLPTSGPEVVEPVKPEEKPAADAWSFDEESAALAKVLADPAKSLEDKAAAAKAFIDALDKNAQSQIAAAEKLVKDAGDKAKDDKALVALSEKIEATKTALAALSVETPVADIPALAVTVNDAVKALEAQIAVVTGADSEDEEAAKDVPYEYDLRGVLMDKGTGKPVTVDSKQVEGSVTFTPKESKGCVEVKFEFTPSSKAVAGATYVVFEDLYFKDVKVATHSDLDDEGQTVTINPAPTGPNKGAITGEAVNESRTGLVFAGAVLLLVAFGAGSYYVLRRRRGVGTEAS